MHIGLEQQQSNFFIENSRKEKLENSFSRTSAHIWNSLSLTIKSLEKAQF